MPAQRKYKCHSAGPTVFSRERTNARRRDAVLPSGAQILSTDFPASEPAATGFAVALPGGVAARCNPVVQPKGCRDALLDLP
jgi:calcium-dependent phosphoinositide phospholipase C